MSGAITVDVPAVLAVDEHEARQLAELARRLRDRPRDDPPAFCAAAAALAGNVPPRLVDAVRDFGRDGRSGALVLAGLPTGPVPCTPDGHDRHVGERCQLVRIQAILAELLGHLIAYEAEGEGALFQDIVPSRPAARTQTSLSSAVELELHTEQAFSALRPDHLSMACLRGDPDARTYLLTARQVTAALRPDEVAELRLPRWVTQVDESFRAASARFLDGDVRGPMPILSGPDDDPRIVLDQDLMRGVDPAAQRLLDRVIEIYLRDRRHHALAAGEVLFLDNQRVVHGRSAFRPRFDGTDRLVVRCFVTRDLRQSQHARDGSRTVASRFS
ncbi:oxygenase [Lentzea tibetensis]|uniref:Oxygenase n=1 Tax=Lentzea tibetensis TaxID=2591470 RepID=A0A563F1N5_9PSEU|nr:TauD/TfdA family dioxygenase [Lentzea tibetensis]TWP53887.1 oxygenase [Lentzea tibetensis]